MVITFKDVSFRYTDKNLLDKVSFSITDQDKTGLVGLNGTGKSTLIKLIEDEIRPQSGEIIKSGNMIISYLEQEPDIPLNTKILDYVMKNNDKDHKVNDYEAKSMLTKLKLDPEALTNNLSGGQRKRLALAKCLVTYCDFLILDEPTNHLDNDMILYLEKYLQRYNHGLFMVTHDRYFLERVCNNMLELDNGHIYTYKANYSEFLNLKALRLEREEKAEKKLKRLLKNELDWIHRGVEARRTKQKYRIERFNELSKIKFSERKGFEFDSVSKYLGKTIIEIKNGSKSFGDKIIFKNFNLNVLRTARIGIVGDNGAGKTTLFKIIMQQESLDSDELILGETLRIGYFSQHFDAIDENIRVIDYVKEVSSTIETLEGTVTASSLLERFLFDANLQYTMVKSLSGGQRRRLQLVRVLAANPNVLILDEPTNDLDIETLEVLEDYIDSFMGPVLCVSHDRYFLDKVCDELLYYKNGEINSYMGSFSEFIASDLGTSSQAISKNQGYKNEHKMTSKEKNELYDLEQELPKLDEKMEGLRKELASYTTEYTLMMDVQKKIDELDAEILTKTERYFELMEKKES
ncbi:aBC transporter ATP-binding protein [Clostridium sp. CAG:307]|nr:aBC transporter ATP-binding protein [Clostridium sp. CAG:307]